MSDFVGDHGSYQLTLSLILFIRYIFLGLMANSGPLMTPDVTFYCKLPLEEVVAIMPNITSLSKVEQELEIREEFKRVCQLDLHVYLNSSQLYNNNKTQWDKMSHLSTGNSLGLLRTLNSTARIRECDEFTYDIAQDQGRTMTSEFDLVCDRDNLRSLFQSLLSASIVMAHVFWGTFSDKYGRFQAQRLCLLISLCAGVLSLFARDFWSFVVTRALCSFGDLGLVVSLTTTLVELVGSQYRGLSVAVVNFGYALGVTLLPYIVAYFEDFRLVIGFTVFCHICTIPFILATNESVRWLLTNRRYNSAKKELKRIVKWNRRLQLWYSRHTFSLPRQTKSEFINEEESNEKDLKREREFTKSERKITRLEERQAFELLFNKFVEQFESQNYQEYLNAIGHPHGPTIDSEPPSRVFSREPEEGEPSEVDCVLEAKYTTQALSVPVTILTQAPDDNDYIRLNEKPELDIRETQSDDEEIRDSPREKKLSRILQQQPLDVSLDHERARNPRTSSSNDIDSDSGYVRMPNKRANSLHLESLLHPSLVAALQDNKRKRTLTLPTLSRCPSNEDNSIMLNVVREYQDMVPLRRNLDKQQPDCINLVAHQLSFVGRVSRLFKDKKLMLVVFTLVWTTFNSELQYTSFIIINLEVGEDLYFNYFLGGCMEALAAISASLLLSYAPRRHSLIIFWLLISVACFGLSAAHIDSHWAVWLLALAKFSQSSLSSIAQVAAYESFPTTLRQSGSGLVFTLGMLGSVFAPLIFAEFDDQVGMDRVLMTFSSFSLTAAILIWKFLNETRNCELQ